ncbi:MAG: LptF/LptG family permease [Bryobacteraceae bacterium]|nr:LptF/LptG family permease [Bryobacteraceae bacterium]
MHGSKWFGLLTRTVLLEIVSSAFLGTVLFTFVVFLERVRRLFEQLVRGSAPPEVVGSLFALLLPPALTFTIPVGVLVGTLIALSRMSADSEITAIRASGISSRILLVPVLAFGLMGTLLTGAASTWLTPMATRQFYRQLNRIAAAELTAEIQPRVFEEQFPNKIIYVGDMIPGNIVRWRNVFLADLTPPAERKNAGGEAGDTPSITIAQEAIATPDLEHNRIQLTLVNGSTHVSGKEYLQYYNTSFPAGDQVLDAGTRVELKPRTAFLSMDMGPLWKAAQTWPNPKERVEAQIELHQRLALPIACLLLALLAVPLGVSSRKGGKSGAFVLTVGIAFLYYMGLITLIGLARQGTLPPHIALWIPNALLLLIGLVSNSRLEKPGDHDLPGAIRGALFSWFGRIRGTLPQTGPSIGRGLPLGPGILDNYILSGFLFYFLLLLISFVAITHVYTFFELLSDILRNSIPMPLVARYLFFLTPKLIYDFTPVSVLVAVLVTFGILTRNNEVTAMKACGVSLYRLAVPVLIASSGLSLFLFGFDHYIVPDANRTQDAIRNQIKGKPVQTYLRPDRKWIFGEGSRIYYYKYFDPSENVMADANVYELDPKTFRLTRHISAERARWEPALQTWVFQNGWKREFRNSSESGFVSFKGTIATYPELNEPPTYFLKEVKQDKQMNFTELAAYIRELQQSGFDTIRLRVQYHKKFAVPLFAVIMALISVPFAFLSAHRGAMAGIGVSFGIGIAYLVISQLFEQVGNVNQLPATLAAWSPDAVFTLTGLYFLARMRT